jgi:hypothetical protein
MNEGSYSYFIVQNNDQQRTIDLMNDVKKRYFQRQLKMTEYRIFAFVQKSTG